MGDVQVKDNGLIIEAERLSFSYEHQESLNLALNDINLKVKKGEFIALLGANGSGKSTLARLINTLLPLQRGKLLVNGFDAGIEANKRDIRRACGMVFQNPDNQFVSSLVEEDIAFGLQNYAYPQEEIASRVAQVLEIVGLPGFEQRNPSFLSGGQKQRSAIAGVLAVDPDILILDEATSMLDSEGRKEVLDTVQRLHRDHQKTVLMITHYVEEAILADRVCLLSAGRIIADGTPREILTQPELLGQTQLRAPFAVRLFFGLADKGLHLPEIPLTTNEIVRQICQSS
ncbi:MAG: energy-coupling factor transporter ATPase [Chloroflexi bacterium]|nr:energy-coupling factor transporter ATPase [Chloroflexota bacterium]